MPDITMCANTHCAQHTKCYRYMAEPSDFRQSYFMCDVRNEDSSCDYFLPLRGSTRTIMTARTEQLPTET